MGKTLTAFVAVATIAASFAARPASAQRGAAAYFTATGYNYWRNYYGAGPGQYNLFWQLRMDDTAFLGRPWLALPPGASLWLIRDCAETEPLMATINVECDYRCRCERAPISLAGPS